MHESQNTGTEIKDSILHDAVCRGSRKHKGLGRKPEGGSGGQVGQEVLRDIVREADRSMLDCNCGARTIPITKLNHLYTRSRCILS